MKRILAFPGLAWVSSLGSAHSHPVRARTRNNLFAILLCICIAGRAESTEPPQTVERPLVIGAALHLTGDYAPAGSAFSQGIELALAEINESGGVDGRPVKVIFEDTSYDMTRVQTIVRKFASMDQVDAMIISNYTEMMRVGVLIERAQIPAVTIWDSSPDIEKLGEYTFGLGVWTPASAELLAEYASHALKSRTAVVLATENEWSVKVSNYFSDRFQQLGGRVLHQITVLPSETDFRSIAARIKGYKPDVVYAPISDNISGFFRQFASAHVGSRLLSSDVLTDELVASLGSVVEGVVQSQAGEATGSLREHLTSAYKKHFGSDCTQTLFVGLGYDSLRVLVEAAKKKNPANRESIKKGLYEIRNFPGAAGDISISPEGSSQIPPILVRAQQGALIPLR